jgi:hypothetical protein
MELAREAGAVSKMLYGSWNRSFCRPTASLLAQCLPSWTRSGRTPPVRGQIGVAGAKDQEPTPSSDPLPRPSSNYITHAVHVWDGYALDPRLLSKLGMDP